MMRGTLIAGLVGGAGVSAALMPAVVAATNDLAAARQAHAEAALAETVPVRAVPLLAPALRIEASTQAAADAAAITRLRGVAARGGVLIEQAAPLPGGAGLVRVRLRVSGGDKAVIEFVDRVEREAPLMRWHHWRVEALADGSVRIEGEVVAAWR